VTDVKLEPTLENFETNKFNDDLSDDDEEEIVPDLRLPAIEPSPYFLPAMYDTDRLHRHHRRDESTLNILKGVISSTPVQVINFKF
jgi:hypothetical protein